MTAFLIATAVVAWLALVCWIAYRATEADTDGGKPRPWVLAGVLWLILSLTGLILLTQHEDDSGPCLRYETRYVMVGKVMTPYRACVERGEWVKS